MGTGSRPCAAPSRGRRTNQRPQGISEPFAPRTEFLADPSPKLRVYAITGMVNEWTRADTDTEAKIISAVSQSRAFFSPLVRERHERENHDYWDLAVNSKLPNVPHNFEGVSGGGLWEIGLTKTQSGQILWDGRRRFRGVAFWQDFPTPDNGRIRCHGPQSIFSEAWRSLNLPPS